MKKVHICKSCGRVMEKPEDFAGEIVGAEFCSNCVDKDGFPKRYSEIIKNLKSKFIAELSVSEQEAEKMALENVAAIPFWQRKEKKFSGKKHILITDIGSTTTKAVLLKKTAENDFALVEIKNAPTTVEKPVEDVKIGVFNAVKKIEEQTGIQLLAASSQPKKPIFKDDVLYLTTSSAGGGLQILVIGLTLFDSASSGKRTAFGAGGVILDTFAIDDKRTSLEQMQAMKILHPDIILMSGGIDGGAISSLMRLGEILLLADPKPKFGNNKIPLIFAGNKDAQDLIYELFKNKFQVFIVPNIRPKIAVENLTPAREKIHQLFLDNVMEQAPGYAQVKNIVDDDIIPTPKGVIQSLKIISESLNENVMAVDIGGATTDIFSDISGEYFRTVSANYGMSYSISNVMKDAGFENIAKWLPPDSNENYIHNYIGNKMLFPTFVPQNEMQIAIEQAVAREAIRMAKIQHLEMNFNTMQIGFMEKVKKTHRDLAKLTDTFFYQKEREKKVFHLYEINIIVGAGGIISHTKKPEQAFAVITDGFQPEGITIIKRDKNFTSPHLGKLSALDENLAEKLLKKDSLENLGIYIHPLGTKWKENVAVMTLVVSKAEKTEKMEIKTFENYYLPNPQRENRKYSISLQKGFYLQDSTSEISFKSDLPIYICAAPQDNFEKENAVLQLISEQADFSNPEKDFQNFIPEKEIVSGTQFLKRELPYEGNILVQTGDKIAPETIVGENLYDPPKIYVISLFDKTYLHLNPENIKENLLVKKGDKVKIGQHLAKVGKRNLLDEITLQFYYFDSPVRGKIEKINYAAGTIIMREIQDYSTKPVTVNVAKKLNVKPNLIARYLKKHLNDFVYAGEILAMKIFDTGGETIPFIVHAPSTGSIVKIDNKTGKLTIRYDKKPFRMFAGVNGTITEIEEKKSVTVSYEGHSLNGIIGFASEAFGKIYFIENETDKINLQNDSIAVFPGKIDYEFLKKATKRKIAGIVAAAIDNLDLVKFTGEEIGVALTGNENIPFPLVITEGFGNFRMSAKLQDFFRKNNGKPIFIDGHTQIRAGVIRPKIIVTD